MTSEVFEAGSSVPKNRYAQAKRVDAGGDRAGLLLEWESGVGMREIKMCVRGDAAQ